MEHIIAKLLQDFEHGKMSRRQLIRSLAATAGSVAIAPPPAAEAAAGGQVFKATAFNHVSYQVADYRKSRDFYAGLFGMKVTLDDGKQCRLAFGDNILIARNRPSGTPKVDHIAYTIAGWDTDKSVKPALKAELERRGLPIRESATGGSSYHVMDPDGFEVQMGGKDQ
jgi:catechol 2,3-dioxygenase-like lactoylglutathione lyase family enzyme